MSVKQIVSSLFHGSARRFCRRDVFNSAWVARSPAHYKLKKRHTRNSHQTRQRSNWEMNSTIRSTFSRRMSDEAMIRVSKTLSKGNHHCFDGKPAHVSHSRAVQAVAPFRTSIS